MKLKDICAIKYGKDHKKLGDGCIPVYGSGGIMRHVERSLWDGPSVLIPRKGTLGNLYFVDGPFWTVDTLFWTDIDEDRVLPKYLFYQLKTKNLESLNVGTAVPSLTTDVLNEVEIDLPPLGEQERVVRVLGALDDKIAANTKLNGYLADLGDTLFAQALKENKQEIAYRTVESFCEVKGGKRLPKGSELISDVNSHPYIRVRDLNNTTVLQLTPEMLYVDDETQANISRYIVNDGDVIVSVVGTIGLTAYIGNTLNGANLTENCNKLTSFNGDLAAWSYFFLRSPDGAEAIRLGTVGAVQAKLPLKNIKSIEVPFIPALEMKKTVAKLNDILSAIQTNLVESLALGELRTTLLPRLISGEIDVSKIDRKSVV